MQKKVKYLLILLLFLILVNVDSVSAKCYKVKDSHTGKIYYTNVVSDLQSYEIPSLVDDSECRKNSSTYKSVGIDTNNVVSCGNIGSFHKKIPELTSWVINLIQVAVPVILIIMGSFDFVKAIASQKDDEIKKGQQVFIKRIITAIIIFFIVVIVKMLVSVVSSGKAEKKNIVSCIDCFISNKCS